ncbi:hypothetical protein DJ84_18380 [Halorubrum ezzemoulense]|nr:hypothetical protein DJ84_18380 [Halorubrum ezzemoulense]
MSWTIGDRDIEPVEVTATPTLLTVAFEISRGDLSYWRQYDHAGDYTVEQGYGGDFTVIDRSGETESLVVDPDASHSPPIPPSEEFLVESYDEEQLSPSRHRVTLGLHRKDPRLDVFDVLDELESGQLPTSVEHDGWILDLEESTLQLSEAQVAPSTASGSPIGSEVTLPVRLDDDQAAAIADTAGLPGAVTERSVPDGDNYLVDDSDGRHTAMINPPAGASLVAGRYIVRRWELTFRTQNPDRRWGLSLGLWLQDIILQPLATDRDSASDLLSRDRELEVATAKDPDDATLALSRARDLVVDAADPDAATLELSRDRELTVYSADPDAAPVALSRERELSVGSEDPDSATLELIRYDVNVLRVGSTETKTVASGTSEHYTAADVDAGGTVNLEPGSNLDLSRLLRVFGDETRTVGSSETRRVSGIDVRPGGTLVLEPGATVDAN